MNWWYVHEEILDKESARNAGSKARQDVDEILSSMGMQSITMSGEPLGGSPIHKLKMHRTLARRWSDCLSGLGKGDGLLLQAPCINHTIFFSGVIRKLKKHGVKIVILIHDLDSLRGMLRDDVAVTHKLRIGVEEKPIIHGADAIISHNSMMTRALVDAFHLDQRRIVDLKIFDYLWNGNTVSVAGSPSAKPIIVAGNLAPHKAGYLYQLPSNAPFALYGIGLDKTAFKDHPNVIYRGSYPANELPAVLDGSFGLVWDGPSASSCEGAFGAYLRINNPHKTSLYLSSGIPVITWDQAAISSFLTQTGAGIAVQSLDDIAAKVASLSIEEYQELRAHALEQSRLLRSGYYTKQAVDAACQIAATS